MKMAMDYGLAQAFHRSCAVVVEVVHLVFIALKISTADMCVDLFRPCALTLVLHIEN